MALRPPKRGVGPDGANFRKNKSPVFDGFAKCKLHAAMHVFQGIHSHLQLPPSCVHGRRGQDHLHMQLCSRKRNDQSK